MGYCRDTFYRHKSAVDEGSVEALLERTRSKPNLVNRVDHATEQAVIKSVNDFPAYGQARTSNELRKLGALSRPPVSGRPGQLQGPAESTGGQGCRGWRDPDRRSGTGTREEVR